MTTANKIEKPSSGQFLTFQLRTEIFGMPIDDVREINQHGEITPVPHAPRYVKGVMNLRGKIIPVINLRVKFGMIEQDITRESCIIVIDTSSGQVGMVVDSVREVLDLNPEQIEPSPHLTAEDAASFVRGMAKVDTKVIILVDVKSAFLPEHLEQMGKFENATVSAA